MTPLQLAVSFQGDKSPGAYAHLAREAERLGFDLVSVYADLLYQPSFYPLLIMSGVTSRIRLGPAGLNPTTLHPVEIAGQTAALDAASGGRAFLGVVRGSWLDRLGIEPRKPLAALRDTVEIVRHLLAGDRNGYNGRVFTLAPGAHLLYEVERTRIPIMVGTWSRGGARVAAELADEVKIGGSANPDMVRLMRGWLAEGSETAGRSTDDVGIVAGAVTAVDSDGRAARRRARREVAMYLDVVLPLDRTIELPSNLIERVGGLVREGDPHAAGDLLPDDVLDRFAFAGTPESVCRQVEDLVRAGVSRIEFGTPHGYPEEEGLRLLGERVLPHFR